MSLKYSTTTADCLKWDEMSNLVRRLSRDGDYKMSLLIAIGCFWGLRISDILSLRWKDILNVDEFTLQEKKTKKNGEMGSWDRLYAAFRRSVCGSDLFQPCRP